MLIIRKSHAFLVLLIACLYVFGSSSKCVTLEECDPKPRRILFMLDASLSIGESNLDRMLRFMEQTFCGLTNSLDTQLQNEAGVIVFNKYVETYIDFGQYSGDSFAQQIKEKVENKIKASCCTSHAEAILLAREMFSDLTLDTRYENIAFIVTDGIPLPNRYKAGDSKFESFYTSRGLDIREWTQSKSTARDDRIRYASQILPAQAQALKDLGVRLFFIGVPQANGKTINVDLFTKDKVFCSGKGKKALCEPLLHSPLVSEPVDSHAFSADTWDIETLTKRAISSICIDWKPPPDLTETTYCNSRQEIPLPWFNPNNCESNNLGNFEECCAPLSLSLNLDGKPSCREMQLGNPWCIDSIFGKSCDEISSSETLSIKIELDFVEDGSCCQTCQAYGDPECVSFDNKREEWVICDARKESCALSRGACESKLDHTGKPCTWNNEIAKKLKNKMRDISVIGSACLPDLSFTRPSMSLYKAANFSLSLELDERGTIFSANFKLRVGEFNLTSPNCVSLGKEAWTKSSALPESFFIREEIEDLNAKEILWQVGDPDTGIITEIVCIQTKVNSRLNIRNVVDLDFNRSEQGGFCSSGVISEMDSSMATPHDTNIHETCTYRYDSLLCKLLGNPSCTPTEMMGFTNKWCENSYGSDSAIATCKGHMLRAKSNGNLEGMLRSYYCRNLAAMENISYRKCQRQLKSRPMEFIQKWGLAAPLQCGSNSSAYSTRTASQQCHSGVSVEYFKNNQWLESFFIPAHFLPCENELVVDGQSHPELFKYHVRFVQCQLPPTCSMESRCTPENGLKISTQYSGCV